jgi:rhomboid protease GluP
MAVEFAQKQSEHVPFGNLTAQQFLGIAIEAANQLGWTFGDINDTGFIAYTSNGLFSWNAEVKLKISDGSAVLQSRSRGADFIDVRENKKTIESFITAFKKLKKNFTPEALAVRHMSVKNNSR